MGEGNGNPLQYSCLENPRDGGAWWAAIYGVAQSRTRLKRLSSSSSSRQNVSFPVVQLVKNQQEAQIPFLGSEDPLEKGMVTHSSMLVCNSLCTEELGGLQPIVLQRVREDSVTSTFSFTFMHSVCLPVSHVRLFVTL